MNWVRPIPNYARRRTMRGRPPASDRERGSLSLMVALLFVALVCLAGIVVDAGSKLNADQNAAAVAQEAARAGATLADQSTAYATGRFVVDQASAVAAARAYLAAVPDMHGTVTAVGDSTIEVTVTEVIPTRFLSLIGIDSMTTTATARAALVSGGA
jgi:Flp pilus assembly protein TadG